MRPAAPARAACSAACPAPHHGQQVSERLARARVGRDQEVAATHDGGHRHRLARRRAGGRARGVEEGLRGGAGALPRHACGGSGEAAGPPPPAAPPPPPASRRRQPAAQAHLDLRRLRDARAREARGQAVAEAELAKRRGARRRIGGGRRRSAHEDGAQRRRRRAARDAAAAAIRQRPQQPHAAGAQAAGERAGAREAQTRHATTQHGVAAGDAGKVEEGCRSKMDWVQGRHGAPVCHWARWRSKFVAPRCLDRGGPP
jgi:hypothetical protein